MAEKLSMSQRLAKAYGSQQIENLKATHAYTHGRAESVAEWGDIWSHHEEVAWAHTFGRMRGFDQIWFGSVTYYDAQAMERFLSIYKKYPEVGGKDPRPLLEASVHTLVTDVIEVADDGVTARGSFITPGMVSTRMTEDGKPYAMILWERYGSDFICEDGEWKYLHEHVCPDIVGELDHTNWAKADFEDQLQKESYTGFNPTTGTWQVPPPLTDPGPMHVPYSVIMPPQDSVPWPEPYETMDNEHTYAPLIGKVKHIP